MALLPILRYPDPRLKTVATPVTQFDDALVKLTQDMAETMYNAPGVGLAATQVGHFGLDLLGEHFRCQGLDQDLDARLVLVVAPAMTIVHAQARLEAEPRRWTGEGAVFQTGLGAYHIDYMIDLHHQGTQSRVDGDLVSGSILYPTSPDADQPVGKAG